MKAVVAMLLVSAALGCAQDAQPAEVKRLSAVTWDLATHKLVWTVEKGTVVDGEFKPGTTVKYEVSPDDAYMAFAGEQRALGEDEAESLHHLLNILSLYCVESVAWWEHPATDTEPATPAQTSPGLVTKPDRPAQPKAPVAPANPIVKV
jgi:hypothetical protein